MTHLQIWDLNGHCYNSLEVNQGFNCEISHILPIKRRILAFGWRK